MKEKVYNNVLARIEYLELLAAKKHTRLDGLELFALHQLKDIYKKELDNVKSKSKTSDN